MTIDELRKADPKVDKLWKECEKYGIEADCNVRWEEGIDHHPEAERIFKMIMDGDWAFMNDYFCWKKGGDGDNGEILMYSLSVMLELEDARKAEEDKVEPEPPEVENAHLKEALRWLASEYHDCDDEEWSCDDCEHTPGPECDATMCHDAIVKNAMTNTRYMVMELDHTKQYGIYYWNTSVDETLLVDEADSREEAEEKVKTEYGERIGPGGGPDQVDIVDQFGNLVRKYHVK